MYLLTQNSEGNFVVVSTLLGKPLGELVNVHSPNSCAQADGCGIHNRPSDHALKDAPMFWRDAEYILERMCKHDIAHPDKDSAAYLRAIGQDHKNLHTCDGCC